MKTDEELEAQVAKLAKRIAELEARNIPKAPFVPSEPRAPIDYTAGMSISPEVMAEMARAVDVQAVVRDLRVPGQLAPVEGPRRAQGQGRGPGTGWVESRPLSNPPGTALADRLLDHADARDKARLIAEEAKRKAAGGE